MGAITIAGSGAAVPQPPIATFADAELTVAVAGLALGGAERIVVDWAARIASSWRVHLIVLRDQQHEWAVPDRVRVTRLHGADLWGRLEALGGEIAEGVRPVCLCHLLNAAERGALARGGAVAVPVVHNAAAGWLEDASALAGSPRVLCVSRAAAGELARAGCAGEISVVRHLPAVRPMNPADGVRWRDAWRIPRGATVIGMVGAVKPQKDYPLALRVVGALHARGRDVYLAIVGGPVGRHGRAAWQAIVGAVYASGLRHRVAMPGFVADAARCLPAFDLFLNTSAYEGFSIATMEAVSAGVPVVARHVGGQAERPADALRLVDSEATPGEWAAAVDEALQRRAISPPPWRGFPAYRLWTLASLAGPAARRPPRRVLFVTANLNAGGAQRSLVNLTTALRPRIDCEVAVCGDSTASYFTAVLQAASVPVCRTAATRDPFDHAEALVRAVCDTGTPIICFWNVDPKIKLLVAKSLAFSDVRIVDVSPGAASFDEMQASAEFASLIAYSPEDFYRRLDRLVLKFAGEAPALCETKTTVIRNGVPPCAHPKQRYDIVEAPRVVVHGRIAPQKFLVEIIGAMDIVRASRPGAELHVFGSAEPRHAAYAGAVAAAAGGAVGGGVVFHPPSSSVVDRLAGFDASVVLGIDQGCPNSVLEALAAGLPVVANDDGGTKEQIMDGQTGLLVSGRDAGSVADAIGRVLDDRVLARRLGTAGRAYVERAFAIEPMVRAYEELMHDLSCLQRPPHHPQTLSNLFSQERAVPGMFAAAPSAAHRLP